MSFKMQFVDAPTSVALAATFVVLAALILVNIRSTYGPLMYPGGILRIKQSRPPIGAATPRLTRKEGM
jgi:hypothetical protein